MARSGQTVEDPIASGREALEAGRWEEARERFELAVDGGGPAEAWEGLSWAAWWLGDEGLTFTARERAYRAYRAAGDRTGAARMAVWVASDYLDFRGEDAPAAGWLERARRLLEGEASCAEQGWLWLMQADLVLSGAGEPEEGARLGRRATRLGRELAVADLEAIGLALEGKALVARGDVAAGMRRLDEASALAASEDFELALSPGWALCCMVSACDGVGDLPRAEQWCRQVRALADSWGARHMMGTCRSAYGNVLATGGDWPAAEVELTAAVDDLDATRPAMAAAGLVRLGELRARQGRAEEAHTLFERAEPHPGAIVGLGRLALRDGDAVAAAQAAERVLRRLPATAVLERLPALELLARARAAAGRVEEAAEPAAELAGAASSLATPYLRGRAHLVAGELAAARGDHEAARCACEDAIDCLAAGSAPYEVALARMVLARSLLALGRPEAAAAETRSARDTFAALGARRDAADADALLARDGAEGRNPLSELTPREVEVLTLVAQGLSDTQIAQRLVVSPHTVHRHVANIRTKLRLPSRAAAVAYAARAGLL